MPKFKVVIREVVTTYREHTIEAEDEDEARDEAENADWREWEKTYTEVDDGIEEIELLDGKPAKVVARRGH